jgi:hypothetical protein
MNKLNKFVVSSVADNINAMRNDELQALADLIIKTKNGENLCDFIAFAIQDERITKKELSTV